MHVDLTQDDAEVIISCIDYNIDAINKEIKEIDLGYMNNKVPYELYFELRGIAEMNIVHLQELKLKFNTL